MIFKYFNYGIYMIYMSGKCIKYNYIKRNKGDLAAQNYVFDCYEKWSNFTLKTIGLEIEVEGLDLLPKGQYVAIANHTSMLDVPILMKVLGKNVGFVGKKEVLKIPILRYWFQKGVNVALDRGDARQGIKAINEGVVNLQEGYSMVIFPEGTRSKNGEILEFKKGSFKLATKSKMPIVPIYIDRASRCYEDNKRFKSEKVKVYVCEAIETKDLPKIEEKELPTLVRNIILSKRVIGE